MKNLRAYSWWTLYAVPERNVGMAPMRRHPANVYLGPKRSHAGPATRRTRSVATKAMMFELPTWSVVRWRSFLMMSWSSGGNAYLERRQHFLARTDGDGEAKMQRLTYQDQKAIIKPNQEKKNTRP